MFNDFDLMKTRLETHFSTVRKIDSNTRNLSRAMTSSYLTRNYQNMDRILVLTINLDIMKNVE